MGERGRGREWGGGGMRSERVHVARAHLPLAVRAKTVDFQNDRARVALIEKRDVDTGAPCIEPLD